MPKNIGPQFISLSTKTCSPIRRESPTDYVATIRIDILYGDERQAIGQGLGGLLALAIAELFDARDIVALTPWPMNPDDPAKVGWDLPKLSPDEQKIVAAKLRKSYMKTGFKSLFRGSEHLFLTHCHHPSATQLIEKMTDEQG